MFPYLDSIPIMKKLADIGSLNVVDKVRLGLFKMRYIFMGIICMLYSQKYLVSKYVDIFTYVFITIGIIRLICKYFNIQTDYRKILSEALRICTFISIFIACYYIYDSKIYTAKNGDELVKHIYNYVWRSGSWSTRTLEIMRIALLPITLVYKLVTNYLNVAKTTNEYTSVDDGRTDHNELVIPIAQLFETLAIIINQGSKLAVLNVLFEALISSNDFAKMKTMDMKVPLTFSSLLSIFNFIINVCKSTKFEMGRFFTEEGLSAK